MSTTARTTPVAQTVWARPNPGTTRWYAILIGLTTLFVFAQSFTSAEFISDATPEKAKDVWVNIHGGVADAAWGFAVIAAVFAIVALRRFQPRLTVWTVVLAVAVLAQTGLGHLISDFGMDWLVPVHIPLAFVVYGLAIWLSIRSALLGRAARAGA